ncbi:hypothetical protein C8Q75DRAFT_772328 [Abortiporus biennis]|nr:hypothetical protein C8Q75DRAFT_772328 [Abortiporus biennis]
MPRLHGFGAWVRVDGKELDEYNTVIENDKVVNCYIASEEGKQFQFKFENTLDKRNYSFEYTVDGEYLEGQFSPTNKDITHVIVTGISTDETTEKPFIFSKLNTSDDDTLLSNNKETLDKIGSIEVKVIEHGYRRRDLSFLDNSTDRLKMDRVHERSKKVGGHRTSLGDSRTVPRTEFSTANLVDPENPLATFVFQYRPRDILQAQGIIRPSSSSSSSSSSPQGSSNSASRRSNTLQSSSPPTGEKRTREDSKDPDLPNPKPKKKARINNVPVKVEPSRENLNAETISAMKRQVQELQEKINRAEGRVLVIDDDDDGNMEIKREREPSPIRVPSTSQGAKIFIDLT